jgi:hypothetical protein
LDREKIKESFQRLIEAGKKGFTIDLEGQEHKPEKGYAVARKTFDTLDDALDHLSEGSFLGYWIDPETKENFIEIVFIFESNFQAFACGMAWKQKAIYNFATDEIIDLRSFYDAADS